MTLHAIGIDPSLSKPTMGVLGEDGHAYTEIWRIPNDVVGARRFRYIRERAIAGMRAVKDVAVIVVEKPYADFSGRKTGFELLASAGILLEAAQAAHHGAVVLDLTTQEWKKSSVGAGNASKLEYMTHAIGLGCPDDCTEDEAAALCCAQAGWVWWHDATRGEAA